MINFRLIFIKPSTQNDVKEITLESFFHIDAPDFNFTQSCGGRCGFDDTIGKASFFVGEELRYIFVECETMRLMTNSYSFW